MSSDPSDDPLRTLFFCKTILGQNDSWLGADRMASMPSIFLPLPIEQVPLRDVCRWRMQPAWKTWTARFLLGIILGLLCGAFITRLTAAPSQTIRVSLLETPGEIRGMTRILNRHMAASGDVQMLRQAMQARAGSPEVDMAPNAFATVSTPREAAEYLRRFPADPERLGWQINCFQTMLIVTNRFLSIAESDVPQTVFTNQVRTPVPTCDPGEYQRWFYPEGGWLAQRHESATGQAFSAASVGRDRVLFSRLPVPAELRAGGLDAADLQSVLDAHWAEHGVVFPPQMGLVLFHNLSWGGFWIEALHTGVLLPRRDGGFVYFEKMGGEGPFVRVDLNTHDELLEVLAYRSEGQCRFLSVNGRIIGDVPLMEPVRNPRLVQTPRWLVGKNPYGKCLP